MTNEQIIFNERYRLMKEGVIGSTGRSVVIEREDGSQEEYPEPEDIHTYEGWKRRGFQVAKGQHAATSFQIWKHCPAGDRKNRKTGEVIHVDEKMILTMAYWFTRDQVEPLSSMTKGL